MATGLWTLASLLAVAGASGAITGPRRRHLSVPIKFVERHGDQRVDPLRIDRPGQDLERVGRGGS